MEDKPSTSPKKSYRKLIGAAVIVAIIVVGVLIFVNHHAAKQPAMTTSNSAATQSVTTQKKPDKTIVIEGTNYKFSPNKLTAQKGQLVELTFKSKEGTHSLNIDAFNVHTLPLSKSQGTLQFTADKTGTFQVYSSVGDDKSKGMTGTLTVQ